MTLSSNRNPTTIRADEALFRSPWLGGNLQHTEQQEGAPWRPPGRAPRGPELTQASAH